MRRVIIGLIVTVVSLIGLVLPRDVWAQQSQARGNQPVVMPGIRLGAPYIGDLYFKSGEEVKVDEEVRGDAYVAGGRVEIDGRVRGDLLAAGGEVWVRGQVDQDVRVVGGEVTIDSQVDRNVTVVGGRVTVTEDAMIAGNLVAAGGEVRVSDRAQIVGKQVVKTPPQEKRETQGSQLFEPMQQALGIIAGVITVVKWLSTLVMGLLLVAVFPKCVTKMTDRAKKKPGRGLLWGAVFSLVAPVIGILLLFTVIGLPLGLLTLVALGVAWYIGKLVAMVYAGRYVMGKISSKKLNIFAKGPNLYVSFLIGIVLFLVLGFIPFLGWFVKLLLVWIGLGALVQEKWAWYRQTEK